MMMFYQYTIMNFIKVFSVYFLQLVLVGIGKGVLSTLILPPAHNTPVPCSGEASGHASHAVHD
jgi:hypothetical protein